MRYKKYIKNILKYRKNIHENNLFKFYDAF